MILPPWALSFSSKISAATGSHLSWLTPALNGICGAIRVRGPRHLPAAHGLRRLAYRILMRIVEDGKLRVILDPLDEKIGPSTGSVQACHLPFILVRRGATTLRALRGGTNARLATSRALGPTRP